MGGCISGKYYCHINSEEDVEPCIFSHFAVTNVKNRPLIDAFKSPYFKNLRNNQPYNKNLLMPCPMIDNLEHIRNIVRDTGAYVTHPSAELMVKDKEFMNNWINWTKILNLLQMRHSRKILMIKATTTCPKVKGISNSNLKMYSSMIIYICKII